MQDHCNSAALYSANNGFSVQRNEPLSHRRKFIHRNRLRRKLFQHDRTVRFKSKMAIGQGYDKQFISFMSFVLSLTFILVAMPQNTSSDYTGSVPIGQLNKHSGHLEVSQLCRSLFPVTRRIEGAVLMSNADANINCTIVFRTKSAQQHFVIQFEELRLDCQDHLTLYDGDMVYGQQSIKDFSCRDSLASVAPLKTVSTSMTMRYSTDNRTKSGDGFRLVATAVSDDSMLECPSDYAYCRNHLCISKYLFCDGINHCVDNSDETGCSDPIGPHSRSWPYGEPMFNSLGLLIAIVSGISLCVVVIIVTIQCRRDNHYSQYQHHLQRVIGVPMQTSSSLMFTNQQPQYHYFQPANMSPYITPQHHAIATATLPRGYSTLPLNLVRQPTPQISKGVNNLMGSTGPNPEYLMMAGLNGPSLGPIQAAPTMQTNLFMPTSQSILPAVTSSTINSIVPTSISSSRYTQPAAQARPR